MLHGCMSPAQTVAVLAALALCSSALAASKKKPPPAPVTEEAPPDCAALADCFAKVEERFSATDFEAASVLARRAEAFTTSDTERARLVMLQATLLYHSTGTPSPEVEQTIVSRFELARRLDPSLTALSIPSYARSQKLEALWARAQPPPEPKVEKAAPVEPPPPVPPPVVVQAEPERGSAVPGLVAGALGVAAAAAGGTFTGLHFQRLGSAGPSMLDRTNVALYRDAELFGNASIAAYSVAGAALLLALVLWLAR